MPIVKRKIPPIAELNVRAELERLNENMEQLSDALDAVRVSVNESASNSNRPDERLSSLSIRLGKLEEAIAEFIGNREPRPSKITMNVTGRNEITGQIEQVELSLD